MLGDEVADLVRIERAAHAGEVVDRPVRRETQGDADVSELEVEIDYDRALTLLRERDREVGGGERLTRAALRADDADHRVGCASGDRATSPRHHLGERDLQFV